jgi:putative glutamine amidotransferase
MKPLIGISCGTFHDRAWCPPSFGHRKTYVDAIVRAGGAPVLLPPLEDATTLRGLYERLDGVVFSGGGDIDPIHYGHHSHEKLGMIDPLRDGAEIPMARWAIEDGKPILGICRGLQVINVAMGGTLFQDIPSQIATELHHNASYEHEDWTYLAHELTLAPDSQLAQLLGTEQMLVNSLHHQSLRTVADGLRPVAWAPDGVVEAVESRSEQFIIGVQCHPEALQGQTDTRWQEMFAAFVAQCTNRLQLTREV